MSYSKNPSLSAMWLTAPKQAKERVKVALAAASNMRGAAEALGISLATLRRWVDEHQIQNPHAHASRVKSHWPKAEYVPSEGTEP